MAEKKNDFFKILDFLASFKSMGDKIKKQCQEAGKKIAKKVANYSIIVLMLFFAMFFALLGVAECLRLKYELIGGQPFFAVAGGLFIISFVCII